jgi:hypothetical protein
MPVIVTEEHIAPEVFCQVEGHPIYWVFKNGDASSPMAFQFSTTQDEGNLRCQFDVRDMATELIARNPAYPLPVSQPHYADPEWTDDSKRQVIRDAFAQNLLPLPDEMDDWWQRYRNSDIPTLANDELPDHDLPDG